MELNLHANATTTPKTRTYIQRSRKSVAQLAAELGVSETTIRRWRGRATVADRSHRPLNLTTSLSAVEERAVCELRTSLQLPLDDIVEVVQRCINAKLSRSAIHRCLQRNGISRRPKPDKPKAGVFETASIGFIHIDLKHLPALQRRTSYAFVAIDRATRYVYVEIHSRRDGETAAGFLKRFLAHFSHDVHTILTDNGAEFTDRFAVDKKNKPPGRPSGNHPFDRLCKQHRIDHRLTRPYHPQTNGMVERFNRRIAEAIGREEKRGSARRTFIDHSDRDRFLGKFVYDYNRTRLKCLGYKAPIQALANLPGPNTCAGTTWNTYEFPITSPSPPSRKPMRRVAFHLQKCGAACWLRGSTLQRNIPCWTLSCWRLVSASSRWRSATATLANGSDVPASLQRKKTAMIFDYALAGLVSAGLLFYLTYALLRPERF